MVEGRSCVPAQGRPATVLEWVVQHGSARIFVCQHAKILGSALLELLLIDAGPKRKDPRCAGLLRC